MIKGRLLDDTSLILRESQQEGIFTDPVDGQKHKIDLMTWIGGKNHGCPIVTIDKHMVAFDFDDIVDEAVRVLREHEHLPKEERPDE